MRRMVRATSFSQRHVQDKQTATSTATCFMSVRRFGAQVALALLTLLTCGWGVLQLLGTAFTELRSEHHVESTAPESLPREGTCNLQAVTCDLPINEVAFLTANVAMSTHEASWPMAHQRFEPAAALRAGVRGFSMSLHYQWPPESTEAQLNQPTSVYICNKFCSLGRMEMQAWLSSLKTFLEDHGNEFVVLQLEQYVASSSVLAEFVQADLGSKLCFASTGHWPSITSLLAQGKQILLLPDRDVHFTGYTFHGMYLLRHIPNLDGIRAAAATGALSAHGLISTPHYPTQNAPSQGEVAIPDGASLSVVTPPPDKSIPSSLGDAPSQGEVATPDGASLGTVTPPPDRFIPSTPGGRRLQTPVASIELPAGELGQQFVRQLTAPVMIASSDLDPLWAAAVAASPWQNVETLLVATRMSKDAESMVKDCTLDGAPTDKLVVLRHMTESAMTYAEAQFVNAKLKSRASTCRRAIGQQLNLLSVDFWSSDPDLVKAVMHLNEWQ